MGAIDLDSWTTRSRALDLTGIAWDEIAATPLLPEAIRALRYMQDIESHTVVYVRTVLATRVIDDPAVAHFLACWFYEEMAHGRALGRFLQAAGHEPIARARSRLPLRERAEQVVTAFLGHAWREFVAVHMTWGAINELTTLHGYQRLIDVAQHPVLTELLRRIIRDEARHFDFYYHQAARRLARSPGARRVTRLLVDRFWRPVGAGVQPDQEVRFLAEWLFADDAGRNAARRIDAAIRRLPGFADAELIEAYLDAAADPEARRRARA
jgi:rubrerythrin